MILYNPELKLLYYGKGKTGTTTVLNAFGFDHGMATHQEEPINGWYFHEDSGDFHSLVTKKTLGYHIIFLMREPYARWCSGVTEVVSLMLRNIHDNTVLEALSDVKVTTQLIGDLLENSAQGIDCGFNENFHTCNYLWEFVLINYIRRVSILHTEHISPHLREMHNINIGNTNQTATSVRRTTQQAVLAPQIEQRVHDYLALEYALHNEILENQVAQTHCLYTVDPEYFRQNNPIETRLWLHCRKYPTIQWNVYSSLLNSIANQ